MYDYFGSGSSVGGIIAALGAWFFFLFVWYVFYFIQLILSYGTAYRYTKMSGDNGVALFGWFIVCGLASLIPGLGIYLCVKSKKDEENFKKRGVN